MNHRFIRFPRFKSVSVRTLSRLNARRATCTTIKILLSASSLALSGITRSSASVVFTRMSVKRATGAKHVFIHWTVASRADDSL